MSTPVTAAPPAAKKAPAKAAVAVVPLPARPVAEELKPTTQETCDRCGPGTQAIYLVKLPSGGEMALCRHDAIAFGFVKADVRSYLHDENKKQGSTNS